ncbi:bifunctional phosphatase PAP2/diacylglycerol kinase family protein [uncultured Tessaracoccus sp.]|uniref:bifunctional phosphatase PAP2/diacylglycerol kinase family protein n=1 Tax=uncultured Tessaracoccus sp. TaxID=905023 RepID=UPI0025CF5F95|nr:bifunctional phosphatase PAP2/diacylglycerol kinase family protein [uncultured Tessaracoccus sp.]
MHSLRRSATTLTAVVLSGLALLVWTLTVPEFLDGWWAVPAPDPGSVTGQVLVIVAGATAPAVVGVAAAGTAWWLARHRFYAVAGAALLAMVLAWSGATVVRHLVGRPRPASPFDWAITQQGPGHPSVHVAVWTAAAVIGMTLASTMRRRVWPAALVGIAAVACVAGDRLWMAAHTVSDVVGGVLLGVFAACLANLLADVHVVHAVAGTGTLRAAVIYNPVKVVGVETFRNLVAQTLEAHGADEVLWLPTEACDPGFRMAERALEAQVDVVLVAGGDGTVRVVLGELADTGQKVGILPSGTGNLLARNLGIPLDVDRALRLALEHDPTPTDLIRVDLPDGTQHAAVLAGIGIDAHIMDDTDEGLKRAIGPAAYVVAGARHLDARPMQVRLTVDDHDPVDVEASLVSIGNVGELQEGVAIMPGASAHDGQLDVLVATPNTKLDMAQMITDVLFEAGDGPNIARWTGTRLRLEVPDGARCQIDGDVVGDVTDVTFSVRQGAVRLVCP